MKRVSNLVFGALLLQFLLTSSSIAADNQSDFNITNKIPQNGYNYGFDANQALSQDPVQINIQKSQKNLAVQNLSSIERIFYQDKDQKDENKLILRQFGYDIFDRGAFLSSNSRVQSSYRFNIGDRVDIFFWGDSVDLIAITGNEFLKSSNDLLVDKEGNISVPGAGLVPARGRTAAQIEQSIAAIVHSKFNKINVKVTLADTGNFPMIVAGNVKYKGTVYLNSNANLLDALSLAGGVQKTGSLREIVYINGRTKSKLTLDLYDILLKGNLRNIRFNEGDMIFVKPVGKVAALREGVKNPGIYEFKNNETLRHLIDYAGGLLPSIDPKAIQVESFDNKKGQRQLKEVSYTNLWNMHPVDGDNIAFKNLYDTSENIVTIQGNVKHPCTLQYKKGMRLSDVIKTKDELLSQTFVDQIVIERLIGNGRSKHFLPVSLKDFFNGFINPELKPMDIIKVYPATTAKTVEVSGYITNPGLIPCPENFTLKKLLSYVTWGDSSNYETVSNNNDDIKSKNIVVEVISNNPQLTVPNTDQTKNNTDKDKDNEKTISNDSNSLKQGDLQQTDKVANNQNTDRDDKNLPPQNNTPTLLQDNVTKIVYLYDLIVRNDSKYDIPIYPEDKVIFRKLLPNETVESVGVFGYVNNPGSFKYKEGMKLKDALLLANGVEKDAYLKGTVLLRPSITEDQQKNIEDTLMKLQEEISLKVTTLQTVSNSTTSNDIQNYLNSQKDLLNIVKEKAEKDYGRLMIEINTNDITKIDEDANIELKPGDEIYIPYQSKHVVVMGEVLNNIAISYRPDKPAKYYIDKVGGYTDQAKKNRVYIIKANGSVQNLSKSNKLALEPGDTIVVPKKVEVPINWIEMVKSFAQIAGNIMSSMYILTKI